LEFSHVLKWKEAGKVNGIIFWFVIEAEIEKTLANIKKKWVLPY